MDFGKLLNAVGHPVLVVVLENEQGVVHLLEGLPLGISGPRSRPNTPFVVELKLHRVGELGKLLLIGKKVHLETFGNSQFLDALFPAEVFQVSLLGLAGATGLSTHI